MAVLVFPLGCAGGGGDVESGGIAADDSGTRAEAAVEGATWSLDDDDCTAHWEAHGATIPCDGNTVYWSEADDSLLYSSDNENTVVHLDRATGEPLECAMAWELAWPEDTSLRRLTVLDDWYGLLP